MKKGWIHIPPHSLDFETGLLQLVTKITQFGIVRGWLWRKTKCVSPAQSSPVSSLDDWQSAAQASDSVVEIFCCVLNFSVEYGTTRNVHWNNMTVCFPARTGKSALYSVMEPSYCLFTLARITDSKATTSQLFSMEVGDSCHCGHRLLLTGATTQFREALKVPQILC